MKILSKKRGVNRTTNKHNVCFKNINKREMKVKLTTQNGYEKASPRTSMHLV
jgi:hypothetical protein